MAVRWGPVLPGALSLDLGIVKKYFLPIFGNCM